VTQESSSTTTDDCKKTPFELEKTTDDSSDWRCYWCGKRNGINVVTCSCLGRNRAEGGEVSQFLCERCWGDAYSRMRRHGGSQTENYKYLLAQRECSPQEQAGQFWDTEKQRDSRSRVRAEGEVQL